MSRGWQLSRCCICGRDASWDRARETQRSLANLRHRIRADGRIEHAHIACLEEVRIGVLRFFGEDEDTGIAALELLGVDYAHIGT